MTKTIQVKKYEGNYFYKASDVIPEELLPELYDSAVHWLESTRKEITEEVYPPEASGQLLSYSDFVASDIWEKFYNEIKKHIAKYCDISSIDLSTIKLHSSWITRIADIEFPGKHTRADLRRRLQQHNVFGNMHSHKNNPVGMVYYLKNPNPKYGTIVKLTDEKIYQNDGEENSLMIFNPRLYHTAIYPSIEIAQKYPRITIVADCIELE
jgi:hypothetical protein